jgi:hypothetical protein
MNEHCGFLFPGSKFYLQKSLALETGIRESMFIVTYVLYNKYYSFYWTGIPHIFTISNFYGLKEFRSLLFSYFSFITIFTSIFLWEREASLLCQLEP